MNTYMISHDRRTITCLLCGKTSHNVNDVAEKYCGNCHIFHEEIREEPDRVGG